MAEQKDEQISKRVEFVAKDATEQIAAGIVMVPDKADLQQDFSREETIRGFASQFETFEEAGEAGGGIQHAAWPDGWMTLERNEVLDEAESFGSNEAPAGAWIQEWRFENDDLWELVDDGILEGYSIGARDVQWNGPYPQDADEVEDVEVPDELGDADIWELVDGIIREVSAVDIPAVPDAQILETKADVDKRLGDYLGNRSGFIEEAMERGHSESEAERLWDVLTEAVNAEGAEQPGKQSVFARAGKAFLSALTGSDDGADETKSPEARDEDKEGRTLSKQNRESLYATIDASLDVLQDAGVDHGMTRFTDREDTSFDLTEHSAREWSTDEDDDDDDESDVSPFENAAGSDTPDSTDNMSDEETNEPPEWAKELQEQIEEQKERIDEALEEDDEEKDAWEDAPEWAKSLKEDVDKQAERIDAISKHTGTTESQQLGGAEKGNGEDDGLNERQKFFIPESKRRA